MVLFDSVGSVGGQWSGGGLGFANLLVVAWVCWDVRFGGSNFILLGLNLIFWVLNWICVLVQIYNVFMFNLSILFGFVFFMWILLFFWVYGFDLL